MDEKQALTETIDLWTQLALKAEKGFVLKKDKIPGLWQDYPCCCPCCEFAKIFPVESQSDFSVDCVVCPMYLAWQEYQSSRFSPVYSFCCAAKSPFSRWTYLRKKEPTMTYDIAFFCWLIVELAGECLESLEGN